jgi:predicted alpha/beta hydrolase family esterase
LSELPQPDRTKILHWLGQIRAGLPCAHLSELPQPDRTKILHWLGQIRAGLPVRSQLAAGPFSTGCRSVLNWLPVRTDEATQIPD